MLRWPCLFKLAGDDELIYLSAETALVNECQSLIWSDADQLIDSIGQQFSFVENSPGSFVYHKQGKPLSNEQVTKLIQAHAFSQTELCLTKIQFPSIGEAIKSVAIS
jgi:hypothetical protein